MSSGLRGAGGGQLPSIPPMLKRKRVIAWDQIYSKLKLSKSCRLLYRTLIKDGLCHIADILIQKNVNSPSSPPVMFKRNFEQFIVLGL